MIQPESYLNIDSKPPQCPACKSTETYWYLNPDDLTPILLFACPSCSWEKKSKYKKPIKEEDTWKWDDDDD